MKTFKFIFTILLFSSFSTLSHAQKKVVEDTVFVDGVCDMCQKRIEEAAYGKGVKFVSWDKVSKQLAIAYRTDKTSIEEVEKRIARAGHSTEHVATSREDYEALPECCKYEHLQTH